MNNEKDEGIRQRIFYFFFPSLKKSRRKWDTYYYRMKTEFPVEYEEYHKFCAELEDFYRRISTHMDLDYNVDNALILNNQGQIKSSQFGWLYLSKILKHDIDVTEKLNKELSAKIEEVNQKIIELDKKTAEVVKWHKKWKKEIKSADLSKQNYTSGEMRVTK